MIPHLPTARPRPVQWQTALLVWLTTILLLTACGGRVDLVSSMPENEANDVVGALLNAGIDAHKTTEKGGIRISVAQSSLARAIEVLRQQGLPRERHPTMGDIFKKENLISSPLEERARYLYALSQELGTTLSQIDGVIAARVHVVLPERIGPGDPLQPSSASIFLKTAHGYHLDSIVPKVRRLVANSIPGLAEDKVAVTLVPAEGIRTESMQVRLEDVLFFRVEANSALSLRILLASLASTTILAVMALLHLTLRGELPWRNIKRNETQP